MDIYIGMSKKIIEEIKRIHTLTYGSNKILEEDFIDKVLTKVGLKKEKGEKIDDPKKADLVSDDVTEFYKTLQSAADSGGLSQQSRGTGTYQKSVESMQIGLMILGYEFPKYGVDGIFGNETANAVSKFKQNHLSKKGELSEKMTQLGTLSLSNLNTDNDGTKNDYVNQGLIDDINKAADSVGIKATITTAKTGHDRLTKGGKSVSRHMNGTGVDVAILNGIGSGRATNANNGNREFRELGDKLKNALVSMGYKWNVESGNDKAVLWQTNTGGNHYNHLHISNRVGASELPPDASSVSGSDGGGGSESLTKASPEMLNKLIELLKIKGVKSEDLKKYIDKYKVDVQGITDESFYEKLLENLGAPVTNENLTFLYAWRQAEGKAGTFNPFNTTQGMPGATNYNKVGVKNYQSIEDGMIATVKTLKNGRYNCIVDGLKNNIGAMNIASCGSLKTWGTGDLVLKVLSGYARGGKPKPKDLA